MKIAFVVTDLNTGGVTSSLLNFCKEFSARGHEVTLFNLSSEKTEMLDEAGTFSYRNLQGISRYWKLGALDLARAKGMRKIGLCLLAAVKKLTNRSSLWNRLIFKKDKTDAYDIAVAFRQNAPCYFYVLNRMQAKVKIAFIHGDVNFMGGNEKSFLPYMPKFHRVAYVANAVKEGFVAKYPVLKENAATVYNMFDVEKIERLAKEPNPVTFSKDEKNIVTVARVSNDDKQVDWIPQICKLLKERCQVPFHWYIVGGGPDLEADQALAESLGVTDCLTFLGNQENPFCILKDADFSVLTSKTESFGMVVLESLILHVPVIACEYPALREIFENRRFGLIAKQSKDDLAEKIVQFLENQNGIADLCAQNLSDYHFTNDTAYQQFLNAVQ